jgi:TctA family transporter
MLFFSSWPMPPTPDNTGPLLGGLIASMWLGNVMLVVLNLPMSGVWVGLLAVPYRVLYPAILLFCAIGAFSIQNSVFDVYTAVFFGFAGYVFVKLNCEPVPLLLGFVLGPMMEEHLRGTMLMSRGNRFWHTLHEIG